jgi:orotidine-5'-phosphate decarboxylase
VAARVLDAVAARNADAEVLGSVGAVVGATVECPADVTAQRLDVNGPLLVPGIGAQGGGVDDVRRVFGSACHNVLPSSSREILRAGPEKVRLHDAAMRAAEDFATLG